MSIPTRGEKYQGKPCKRGHSGLRYRSSSGCVECTKILKAAPVVHAEKPDAP